MGNRNEGRANRCPKCKSPFEKIDGCQHMTCLLCGYEWCWVCGLPYLSIFHYGQAGGLMCEMIGKAAFAPLNVCVKYIILTLVCLFLPLILIIIFAFMAGAVTTIWYQTSCCHKACWSWTFKAASKAFRKIGLYRRLAIGWKKVLICPIAFLAYFCLILYMGLMGTIFVSLFLLITLAVYAIILLLFTIPCMIMFIVAVIRLHCIWGSMNNSDKKPE